MDAFFALALIKMASRMRKWNWNAQFSSMRNISSPRQKR
jgi:hypothetical protein